MWGKLLILTSSTVVYDNNEAEKTCFNLFYDSYSKETVTLYGSCINEINVDEGWCIVECATCNIDLLIKLDYLIKECSIKVTKVNNTWKEHGHTSSFVCIVSHPHDFPKQVTMGYWKDKEVVQESKGIEYTRYQYTTPTCHGSAGAFVYILGVSDISAKHYHVYLGVRNVGYNYCSTGKERKNQ
ncbi:unnamed protein product [Lymnaea stagnalis]|uniref:Uncharacterized protein n=1 Tax=Lymnaea stagnalis TaxID=6523 RepID=A0AAV2HB35_LYMST